MSYEITLAYAGTHKGETLTTQDLKDMAEVFNSNDVPVYNPKITHTHNDVTTQKTLGNLSKVWLADDVLKGNLDLLDGDFKTDYDKGLFPRRSVGVRKAYFNNKRVQGNKTYLQHLALLGGQAPKITGLSEFSDDEKAVEIDINFADAKKELKTMTEEQKRIKELEEKLALMESAKDDDTKKDFAELNDTLEAKEKELKELREKAEENEKVIKDFAEKELEGKKEILRKNLEGIFNKEAVNKFFENKDFSDTDNEKWLELINSMPKSKPSLKLDMSDGAKKTTKKTTKKVFV